MSTPLSAIPKEHGKNTIQRTVDGSRTCIARIDCAYPVGLRKPWRSQLLKCNTSVGAHNRLLGRTIKRIVSV